MTLAATIPNVMMYRDGYVSKTLSTDFSEIISAPNTTATNGIIGDKTLVPYTMPQEYKKSSISFLKYFTISKLIK